MYVYKLINFKENAYLFTRSGNLVYDITRYPCIGKDWNNCKSGNRATIYYFDYKSNTKRNRRTTLILKTINFLSIPSEIQGIFYLYNKDIYSIKNTMNTNQWNQFLNKYGETK